MLSVTKKLFMLCVIMLYVIMLSVVAPWNKLQTMDFFSKTIPPLKLLKYHGWFSQSFLR